MIHSIIRVFLCFKSKYRLGLLFVCLLNLSSLFAEAPIVNNNAGSWTDNLNDQLGASNLNNISIDVIAGSASLSTGQNSGSQTTVIIKPPSFDSWLSFCMDATYSSNTDLTIDFLNGADDSPIIGYQGLDMSMGDVNGCFDISGLNILTYPTLKVKINHTRGGTVPIVNQINVTWNPQTVLLFDKRGPETVIAGTPLPYKLRVSVNFIAAEYLVIWDTLPKLSRGTVVYETGEDYGQNDEPEIDIISDNGIYILNDTIITTANNTYTVPGHSVLWYFEKIEEGTSLVLQAFVKSPNGTLDGTKYFNSAAVRVDNGNGKDISNIETTILSTPLPQLTKAEPTLIKPRQSGIFPINGTNYAAHGSTLTFFIQDPIGGVDGNDYAAEGRERMYETVLWDNLNDYLPWIAGPPTNIIGTHNGITVIGQYTVVPVTIGTTVVPANSVYWNLGTLQPGILIRVNLV